MNNVALDYDGVITEGIEVPEGACVITGRPESDNKEILKTVGRDVPIYNLPESDTYSDEICGRWKAEKIKELKIDTFYEDSVAIIDILKREVPDLNIIQVRGRGAKTVVFVTDDFLTPDLAYRIQKEGHNVLIAQKSVTRILEGTLKRIPYDDRFKYIKDSDLVIYDSGSEGEASELRKKGHSVVGGDEKTDRLEGDRVFGVEVAESLGILVPKTIKVDSFDAIRKIIKDEPKRWVMKQEGNLDRVKGLNFVAKMPDSSDLLEYLDYLENIWIEGLKVEFVMQEFIEGHEMAVGAWWNGNDFMKDKDGNIVVEENWEHKSLFPGNLGESTGEQFTIMCYKPEYKSKIYRETLEKCIPLLKEIDFRGDFDINCKINEKGAYFLEFTPRMGVPATSGQISIHKTPWYEFLKAVADGHQVHLEYDERYTIVSWLYTKPFPYVNDEKLTELYEDETDGSTTDPEEINRTMSFRLSNSENIPVMYKEPLTDEELNELHFDGIRFEGDKVFVGNSDGYVMTVTGKGGSVEEAAEKVEDLLKKIIVPKGFWRNDFTKNFCKACMDLSLWGYMTEHGGIINKY